MRYYSPKGNSEVIPEIHGLDDCFAMENMPLEAQQWFTRPAKEGYEWKCLNGKWPEEVPLPLPTRSQIQQKKRYEWKARRDALVSSIKVFVDGLTFDGDEISMERMMRAVSLASSEDETKRWILADNTTENVTIKQLRSALKLAENEFERIWTSEGDEE